MSSFILKSSSSLMSIINDVPTRQSFFLPETTISWAKDGIPSSSSSQSLVSLRHNRSRCSHQISSFITRVSLLFSSLLGAGFLLLGAVGYYSPITAAISMGCFFIAMITRLIVAVKNLLHLNRSKQALTNLIISISDKTTVDRTLSISELKPISNAAKTARKAVNSQRAFQSASIAGAVISLLGIIGLATTIALSIASIYGNCHWSYTNITTSLSVGRLLLLTSASIVGLSGLFHAGLAIGSLARRACYKNTSNQLKVTISKLASQRKAYVEKTNASSI